MIIILNAYKAMGRTDTVGILFYELNAGYVDMRAIGHKDTHKLYESARLCGCRRGLLS